MKIPRRPQPPSSKLLPTPDDLKKLIKEAESRSSDHVLAIRLMAQSGFRFAELAQLKVSDFDPVESWICVPAETGSKVQVVPLRSQLDKLVDDLILVTPIDLYDQPFLAYIDWCREVQVLGETIGRQIRATDLRLA